MRKISYLVVSSIVLAGCTTVKYNPNDFVLPNQIVEKKVEVPALPAVRASYGIGNDPAVVKAYQTYSKTGKMESIRSDGFVTYPFSSESRPIISCSPLNACIVDLEAGEELNSVSLTNKRDWISNVVVTGKGQDASVEVQVEPKADSVTTDLRITTNKRGYLIGLVSKPGATTTVLRFYYPEETMTDSINQIKSQQDNHAQVVNSTSFPSGTQVDVKHINFNYKIDGDKTPWRPLRIFDDANKTYIEMPAMASRFELPVLYLAKNKELQMVNYRYEQPYFIVDGLFSKAWLISGKGSDQQRVEIINENM